MVILRISQDAHVTEKIFQWQPGLQRSNDDKRKAVLGMLADFADWSDRAIAKHVGVDGKTVAAQRESHCGNSAVTPTERAYTTKHGTTATMNVAGQKKAGKERAAKPAPTSEDAPKSAGCNPITPAAAERPAAPTLAGSEFDSASTRPATILKDRRPAMNEQYKAKARKHWTEWLPEKVSALTAAGELDAALQLAANQCRAEVDNLMAQGFHLHEAEEVALPQFILLKPEPKAKETQRAELAAIERRYRKLMR